MIKKKNTLFEPNSMAENGSAVDEFVKNLKSTNTELCKSKDDSVPWKLLRAWTGATVALMVALFLMSIALVAKPPGKITHDIGGTIMGCTLAWLFVLALWGIMKRMEREAAKDKSMSAKSGDAQPLMQDSERRSDDQEDIEVQG